VPHCHDHGHFAKNCPKSQQSQLPPTEALEFKTSTSKRRNPQCKVPHQPRKPRGNLQNNQYGDLENLGDTKNPEDQGKDPGIHPSKGVDRSPEE